MRTVLEIGVRQGVKDSTLTSRQASRPPGPLSQQSRDTASGSQCNKSYPVTISKHACYQTLSGHSFLFCQQIGACSFRELIYEIPLAAPTAMLHVKRFSLKDLHCLPVSVTLSDFRRDLGLTPSDLVKWPHVSTANGTLPYRPQHGLRQKLVWLKREKCISKPINAFTFLCLPVYRFPYCDVLKFHKTSN